MKCGGILKPDVVFFGDNVAREVVDHIYSLVDNSDTFLVLGSSLFVRKTFALAQVARTPNTYTCVDNYCFQQQNVNTGDMLVSSQNWSGGVVFH